MSYRCPVCQRSFGEPGFCPFDGKKLDLASAADHPTVLPPQQATVLSAQQAAVVPPEAQTNKLQAMSAMAGGSSQYDALQSMRARGNEYDRLIGETLDGRYFVQRKLGEGGMGVVFAVKHNVIERPLAIKVLKREVMRDQATVKRFIQEARAASRIGHPNIVDVTDFGNTADGMTYQVMEMIDGVTLKKAIKEMAPLPPDRVVRIGVQIARALAAAHAKGIVHRDLKPENVFLTEREGRPDFVKIVDFGIAKVAPVEGTTEVGPRLTRQGSVFGTPEYMAPEQAAGRSDTDHRVDVYALGTILYEMLVAKTPHKGSSMVQTIAMQMLDPVVPPSKRRPDVEVPPELEAIVMKALEKKREDRHATMADLLAALDALTGRLAVAPTAPADAPTLTGEDTAAQAVTNVAGPRRAKPATRQLHEPEFVAPGAPVRFDHVYDNPPVEDKPSRWPMVVAGLAMLVLGAGGAILLVMKLGKETPVVTEGERRDAAVIVEAPIDAGADDIDAMAIAELPADAGTKVTTAGNRRDGGVAGVAHRPDKKGNVTIEVLARPGDADVFVGVNYRGPSGVRITERHGTKLKIECKTARMKGSIEVVFDGSRDAVMCTATRERFCVTGLKNPYDDCEEDPNAMP